MNSQRWKVFSYWVTFTVVVLAGLNLLLGVAFGLRELHYWRLQRNARAELLTPREGRPKSTDHRTDYQLKWIDERAYTGVDANRVQQVLTDFYDLEKLGYRFSPYVHYSNVPFSSPTVNVSVNEEGFDFRRTPGSTQAAVKDEIYLFGGSTTFGTHVADDWTMAAYLQTRLPQFKIVNFGRPNYSWFQELVLFQRLLHASRRPVAAVFVDGVNVFSPDSTPIWSDKMKSLWEESQLGVDAKALPDVIPMFRLVNYLNRQIQEKKRSAWMFDRFPASQRPLDFLTSYQNTQDQIRAIGAKFGVRTVFIIQPNRAIYCDSGQYTRPLPSDYTSIIRPFYSQIEVISAKDTHNLSHLCEEFGVRRLAFVDDVHYSPDFNSFIADKLIRILTAPHVKRNGQVQGRRSILHRRLHTPTPFTD